MKVVKGKPLTLVAGDGTVHMVRAGEPVRDCDSVIPTADLIGLGHGERATLIGREYTVVGSVWHDAIPGLSRGPQIIAPETVVLMVYRAGIVPGSRVVEGGTGTGCATLALAAFVGDEGHVDTYDLRAGALDLARANLARCALDDRVSFHHADVADCDIRDADAMTLDVPEPWTLLDTASSVLRPGGFIVAYLPTVTQVERLMRFIGEGFTRPSCHEAIHREWVLSKSTEGLRPSFTGPAHSGFLVLARRI